MQHAVGNVTTLCVGRDAELEQLRALYAQTPERGERLALLEGPSGAGKSRIVQEFRNRVRLEGGVVLEGRAEPGRAFWPFADIVQGALRFLAEVGAAPSIDLADLACSSGCHAFWHQHAGDASADAPASTSARPATASPGAEIEALERRIRFFDAIRGVLADVARVRPPVVLIHGLGRADRGTFQLLSFLLEGTHPWADAPEHFQLPALFVASVRPEREGAPELGLGALRHHASTVVVPVGSLTADGIRQLLSSPEAVARVLARTGGIPEAIDSLLDSEPPSPEARIERRLLSLSEGARSLTEALAVVERPADIDTLARVSGIAADAAACGEFGRLELVSRSIVDGRILFRFARERDREIVYALVATEPRRSLHARCLDVVRQLAGDAQEAATHALRAGLVSEAEPLALEAAQSLAARHAHGEAAALLEHVLEAAGGRVSLPVREQLADLYRVAGDYRRALSHANAVRAVQPEDAAAARRVGELLTLAGELDLATETLEEAHRLAESSDDPTTVVESEALLAELYYQRAAYADARRWASRALEAADTLGALVLELSARNTLGKLALAQQDAAAAAVLFEENRRKSANARLGHQEAQALTNLGVAMLRRQDLAAAEASFERAIEVATRANDTRERAISTENLAVLAHLRRDYRLAQTRYHEAVSLLKRLGNRSMLARVANNLGELYLSMGDVSRARTMCEFATHVGGPWLPPSVVGEGLLLRGRVEAYQGSAGTARAAFEAARRTWSEIGAVRVADALLELAKLALADGDVPAARSVLVTLPVQESPKRAAEVAIVTVDVERAAGADTLAPARRAVELAEHADDEELLLPALARLARAHVDRGETALAARLLETARAADEKLGAKVPEDCHEAWASRPVRRELAAVDAMLASSQTTAPSEPPRANVTRSSAPPPSPAARDARLNAWRERYPNIVGSSPAVSSVLALLDKAGPSDCLVLVRGESGTGKELIAEAVHQSSARRDHQLVKVNCAALVETLLLSELFGHERGAFTGAQARKKGRFELADGGTLFLDEIGDISAKTQVALLRVLQEREFERVGGTQAIKVDVRIVAATHRDLEKMVRDGEFREDLYYRLRGITIEMPSLRRRLEDLPELCRHLLVRIGAERGEAPKAVSPDGLRMLAAHRWPGNVRELDNVLRSATLFAESSVLGAQDFAAFAEAFQPSVEPEPEVALAPASLPPVAGEGDEVDLVYRRIREGDRSLFEMKKDLERECIVRALAETGGNITRAATLLGMKRPRLSQLVKQYGLSHAGEA